MSKGARRPGQGGQETGTSFPSPLPAEFLRTHSISPAISWENTCKMLSPGKLIRDKVPGVSTGGWSCRHPLAGTYQNSRLPEGEQVLIVNQIVYKTSWGTVSHPDQFWKQWEPTRNPSSQMPVKGQPCQQAFVMLAASGLLSYLFSAQIHTCTGTRMGTE